MRDTLRLRLLRTCNVQGGLSIQQAAIALGEDWQRVRRVVRVLMRDGMLEQRSDLRYRPTSLGLDHLQERSRRLQQLTLIAGGTYHA